MSKGERPAEQLRRVSQRLLRRMLQLNFEDGSTSQYDMVYREGSADGAKLTAFFLEFVDMDTVESIQVGNLIVPLE